MKTYEFRNIQLIEGDALEVLKTLDKSSVDAVITDPPYNVLGKTQKWDNFDGTDFIKFTREWMELAYDVAKDNAAMYVFWAQKYIKDMLNIETKWEYKRMLIWWHPNLAKPTNKMYLWTYDVIFYFTKGKPKFHAIFTNKENVDVFKYPKPQSNWNDDNFRFHPASKPVELIENFIKVSTDEGDVILDMFAGGGTTGIAALRQNRKCILIEKEHEYVEIILDRIKKYNNLDIYAQTEVIKNGE